MKAGIMIGKDAQGVQRSDLYMKIAKQLFDEAYFLPMHDTVVLCNDGETKIFCNGHDLKTFDAIFMRPINKDFLYAEVLLELFEHYNVYSTGSAEGFQIAGHKFASSRRVTDIGVPVPDSSLTVTPDATKTAVQTIGYPVVLKLLRGVSGKGVMIIRSEDELKPVLETLQVFNEFPTAEKFLFSRGEDLRALVIGKEVIGVMRKSSGDEFRANTAVGGTAQLIELSDDMKEMAIKVAELLDMEICAVDFVVSEEKPYFIEVNFTPGTFPEFFGDKVAKKMLTQMYETAKQRFSRPR